MQAALDRFLPARQLFQGAGPGLQGLGAARHRAGQHEVARYADAVAAFEPARRAGTQTGDTLGEAESLHSRRRSTGASCSSTRPWRSSGAATSVSGRPVTWPVRRACSAASGTCTPRPGSGPRRRTTSTGRCRSGGGWRIERARRHPSTGWRSSTARRTAWPRRWQRRSKSGDRARAGRRRGRGARQYRLAVPRSWRPAEGGGLPAAGAGGPSPRSNRRFEQWTLDQLGTTYLKLGQLRQGQRRLHAGHCHPGGYTRRGAAGRVQDQSHPKRGRTYTSELLLLHDLKQPTAALEPAERARARNFLDQIGSQKVDVTRGVDPC